MNQDIIDWLDGYWVSEGTAISGICNQYTLHSEKGCLEYHPETNTLYISSGLGLSVEYGYEVQIQDLQHLIQLEALL